MSGLLLTLTLIFLTWGIGASLLTFRFYKLTSSMSDDLSDKDAQIKVMHRELNEQKIELGTLHMKLEVLKQSMESMQSLDDKLTSSRRTSFGTVNDSRAAHGPREGGFDTTGIVDIRSYIGSLGEDCSSSNTSSHSNDDSSSSYSGSYSDSSSSSSFD